MSELRRRNNFPSSPSKSLSSDSPINSPINSPIDSNSKQRNLFRNPLINSIYQLFVTLLFFSAFWLFIRGDFTWKWFPHMEHVIQNIPLQHQRDEFGLLVLTPEELALYDGSNNQLPIYLAINGKVYDVSKGKSFYGPGGSYSTFAGIDATRSFITGCFDTHRTHDLRGLSRKQIQSLDKWVDFFDNSKKYHLVGHVVLPDIDPESPIPEDC